MPTENTSRVNGYLTPVGTAPPYDADLDEIIQWYVRSLTGLHGDFIRPRWQKKSPVQPPDEVTWCAVGVINVYQIGFPQIDHQGTDATNPDDGTDTMTMLERVEIVASFYGPSSQQYCATLRDGCYMPQNNDQLKPYGMALSSVDSIRSIPTLRNTQWLRRYDLRFFLNRMTKRTYQVRNLASASFNINKD